MRVLCTEGLRDVINHCQRRLPIVIHSKDDEGVPKTRNVGM